MTKTATWFVVRRGGVADFQRWHGDVESLPYPYISGPFLTQKIADREAGLERAKAMAPVREAVLRSLSK